MPRIYVKKNQHEVRHGNSKMDAEVVAKLELAFAGGHSDGEACLIAGISQKTLSRYEDKNPDFLEKKELLRNTPILKARQTINRAIETNPDIAFKFLERKKRDEFGIKTEVDVTSLGGRVVSFNYLPPVQLEGELINESNAEANSQTAPSIPETAGQDY